MKSISIIVPTLNENGNIGRLIERIHTTLTYQNISYEIIVVDDHSTDTTRAVVKRLSQHFPVILKTKLGNPGKAQSLIEGFSYAKYDLLCMIDADLQYPPESIPEMMKIIEKGSDIIVANREQQKTSSLRQFLSKGYLYFFGRVLHGFTCDVQSGMKVFKKEIIERITLNPKPWTFDLEFLLKARNAGYNISTVKIDFAQRSSGRTKIKLFNAISQIGWTALRYKFVTPEIVKFHKAMEKKKGKGFHHKGQEFIHHSNLPVDETAFYRLSRKHKIILCEIILITILSLLLNWHETIIIALAVLTAIYFIDLLFNLYLVYRSFSTPSEIQISDEEIAKLGNNNWPTYTVFCPLYKEWQVVPQFVTAMSRLDYPKNKLQVMLLLEEDDKETIHHIRQQELPNYFEIIIVPNSQPKTKPKACNYTNSQYET